ncbi:MAG: metal ABC transporter permease [Syntrophobacteraceae bacterium]|nr:metal ABC transporter permease [Syntrophobacteraceae bacterium]
MVDLTFLYNLLGTLLPFEFMQARFMQQALLGLVLLAPMCAAMGVQVVNFRMAFFSDAISHSAFTGVALGLILGMDVRLAMVGFALFVGLVIVGVGSRSRLSTDTLIGVFFSAVNAFGIAVVSRDRSVARDLQRFLYGDILTIGDTEIASLVLLFLGLLAFQAWGYNRLLYLGVNPLLASVHGVRVRIYQYLYAGWLSVVVIYSVWAVGVLLVTAMLVVPTAAARNFARSAGGMFWWALLVGWTSAIMGLILSAQPWARTATGATVILCAFLWFILSQLITIRRKPSTQD